MSSEEIKTDNIDTYYGLQNPFERYLKYILVKIKRDEQKRFTCERSKIFTVAVTIMFLEILGLYYKVYEYLRANNYVDFQRPYTLVINLNVVFLHGITIFFQVENIAKVLMQLDDIFPATDELKERIKFADVNQKIRNRYKYYYNICMMAYIAFILPPIVSFALYYRDFDEPVPDDYHPIPSWMPFGLKQNYRTYIFTYVYECCISTSGASFLFLSERWFTSTRTMICMHYTFICNEFRNLDARQSMEPDKRKKFYNELRDLLVYEQKLNYLTRDFSDIYKVSIFITDAFTAASATFNIYLLFRADTFSAIFSYLSAIFLLYWNVYNVSSQGTELEELTVYTKECLYSHNWYEGSIRYRKLVGQWMQYTYTPFRFHGYQQFEVNMVHFQKMLTYTYQLLAFVQSLN